MMNKIIYYIKENIDVLITIGSILAILALLIKYNMLIFICYSTLLILFFIKIEESFK